VRLYEANHPGPSNPGHSTPRSACRLSLSVGQWLSDGVLRRRGAYRGGRRQCLCTLVGANLPWMGPSQIIGALNLARNSIRAGGLHPSSLPRAASAARTNSTLAWSDPSRPRQRPTKPAESHETYINTPRYTTRGHKLDSA
jgi:hypothetical protein